jgi:hypothetical protein
MDGLKLMHQIVLQLCKRCRPNKEVRLIVPIHVVETFLGGGGQPS